ncbi:MAG: hypothetical protein U1E65_27175 [Myxococcota bacterium]
MRRSLGSSSVLTLVLAFTACDRDALTRQMDPPDAGEVETPDAGPPDLGVPDAGTPDLGTPDSGIEQAHDPLYVHTGSTLYSFDLDTNQATVIGDFHTNDGPVTDLSDIAIDSDGRMFGGSVSKKIYVVHPDTAELDERYSFNDRINGLTFLPSGHLVIAGDDVTEIDADTGRTVKVLVHGSNYQTSGDIIGLPDGQLYWTVRGTGGNNPSGDLLIRIDPSDGSTQRLGACGVERIYGLGYANDTLVGFASDGTVVHLDPRNGRSSSVLMMSERWWGATTNPVTWP